MTILSLHSSAFSFDLLQGFCYPLIPQVGSLWFQKGASVSTPKYRDEMTPSTLLRSQTLYVLMSLRDPLFLTSLDFLSVDQPT